MQESPFAHALTIDVEGFAESRAESVRVDPALLDPAVNDCEIAQNLAVVLDLLARHHCHGTFFFLGRIARTAPELVKRVSEAGHEIACHSLFHRRITGQTPAEFREQLSEAKGRLEDSCGRAVVGFRAPYFAIGPGGHWAWDEIMACGFKYDSSVVHGRIHDGHEMAEMPRGMFRWPNGLVEFPLPVVSILGRSIPVGGGGYFRLYPVALTRRYFIGQTRRGVPSVFYIHPYEIGPAAPRLEGLTWVQRFRYYVSLQRGRMRLPGLLDSVPFATMSRVLTRAELLDLEE